METRHRRHSRQRAISTVISEIIMAAFVIAMGVATFAWSQGVSLNFMQGYNSAINADIDRLKERLTTEYVSYKRTPPRNVTVYLMNCGSIDDVTIKSITINNSTFTQTSQNPVLKLLGTGTTVPDLDQGQEGYVYISLSTALTNGQYYYVTIVTVRGMTFNAGFVV